MEAIVANAKTGLKTQQTSVKISTSAKYQVPLVQRAKFVRTIKVASTVNALIPVTKEKTATQTLTNVHLIRTYVEKTKRVRIHSEVIYVSVKTLASVRSGTYWSKFLNTGHVPLFANPLFAKNWQRTVVCQLFDRKKIFWQETVVCQLFSQEVKKLFWT